MTIAAATANQAVSPVVALIIYTAITVGVGTALMAATHLFGPVRKRKSKGTPYECGMPLLSDTRQPFNVRFFVVAVLFILFDVELILLVPWAIAHKSLGMVGFVAAMVFLVVLGVGMAYEWRKGALEWD